MNEMLTFSARAEFRAWLEAHCPSDTGYWLLFGKAGGPKSPAVIEEQIDAVVERLNQNLKPM